MNRWAALAAGGAALVVAAVSLWSSEPEAATRGGRIAERGMCGRAVCSASVEEPSDGGAVDSGPADAGFVDAGSCPPDCGLLTDEYAAQFEGDGYMAAVHGVIDNLTNKAHVTLILVYRQPGVSGTEEWWSEYNSTPKTGIVYDHSTERHLGSAPNDNSTPTQRTNTADAGTIPTNPLIECMAVDMTQASNVAKFNWYRYEDGGTKVLGKYSVGTAMGSIIRSPGDAAMGFGGRASVDGGSTVRASGVLSEAIIVDGLLDSTECDEFAHYSADAGQRAIDPRGHTRWASMIHWWRFGDSVGDDWYDGGTVVEDQIGANDLVVVGPIERIAWSN